MILAPYLLGIGWLCWWASTREGAWREAGALFFSPILPVCAAGLILGRFPWIFFVPYAHLTALVFLPIYWAFRRDGGVGLGFPVFVGAFAGVVTAFATHGWKLPGKGLLIFVALGVVSGLLFWVLAFFTPRSSAISDD